MLPVISVPESVRAPRDTLVRVGHGGETAGTTEESPSFPSYGGLAAGTSRTRPHTTETETPPVGGDFDARQW